MHSNICTCACVRVCSKRLKHCEIALFPRLLLCESKFIAVRPAAFIDVSMYRCQAQAPKNLDIYIYIVHLNNL